MSLHVVAARTGRAHDRKGMPLWRPVHDYIAARMEAGTLAPGDLLSHRDLRAQLPSVTDGAYYAACTACARRLRGGDPPRDLLIVRKAGYRLIAGSAQVEKGVAYKERARRQIHTSQSIVARVDRTGMSSAECLYADQVQIGLATLGIAMTLAVQTLAKHEEELQLLMNSQENAAACQAATSRKVDSLHQRLDAIEQQLDRPE